MNSATLTILSKLIATQAKAAPALSVVKAA